jgi:hypothetical protein
MASLFWRLRTCQENHYESIQSGKKLSLLEAVALPFYILAATAVCEVVLEA